jgi:hypothetical protein
VATVLINRFYDYWLLDQLLWRGGFSRDHDAVSDSITVRAIAFACAKSGPPASTPKPAPELASLMM